MPTCDTSWLIALFDTRDAHHADAIGQAQDADVPATVPGVILGEFLNLVTYRLRQLHPAAHARELARTILQEIEGNPGFSVDGVYDTDTASAIYHRTSGLSYPDAVAIAVAKAHDGRLLTFDRRQRDILGP